MQLRMAAVGWLPFGVCALALLGACGGHARDSGTEQAMSGASGAGLEMSGNGGASPDGGTRASANAGGGNAGTFSLLPSGDSGAAGSAGAPTHAARPCDAPTPRAQGGGYLLCADGSLRRPAAAACASSLPRAAPNVPLLLDECTTDTDCTNMPYGFCVYGGCKYGCVVDDDCAVGEACFCGEFIGACVSASCRSDADCPADFPCTGYQAPGFAAPDSLACQSPLDACVTDAQCGSLNPRVSCKVQMEQRICYQDTVG